MSKIPAPIKGEEPKFSRPQHFNSEFRVDHADNAPRPPVWFWPAVAVLVMGASALAAWLITCVL